MTIHELEYTPEDLSRLGNSGQSHVMDFLRFNPQLVKTITFSSTPGRQWKLDIVTRDITDAQARMLSRGMSNMISAFATLPDVSG